MRYILNQIIIYNCLNSYNKIKNYYLIRYNNKI